MAKLTQAQVDAALTGLPGWASEAGGIRKQFAFESFPAAVAFVVRLGFDAEAADHHPDILINYRKVTLTWSTHSEDGVTQKDIDGAKASESIAATGA
jgi:4a-hydroxytetrahydrobiopterin dehydratase